MSGRRVAWICAELTADAERRLKAAGCEPDREALHRLLWPLSRRLAKAQTALAGAEAWYLAAVADATRAAVACATAIDVVAVPHEQRFAELEACIARDEGIPYGEEG